MQAVRIASRRVECLLELRATRAAVIDKEEGAVRSFHGNVKEVCGVLLHTFGTQKDEHRELRRRSHFGSRTRAVSFGGNWRRQPHPVVQIGLVRKQQDRPVFFFLGGMRLDQFRWMLCSCSLRAGVQVEREKQCAVAVGKVERRRKAKCRQVTSTVPLEQRGRCQCWWFLGRW